MARALLIPIGSSGDVHPFVGLGVELKRRGWQVHMLTSAYFEPLVRKSGFAFTALGTAEEFKRILDHPDLWHPRRSFEFIARNGFDPAIRPTYDFITHHFQPGHTLVVASSLAFGARLAEEKRNVPTVTLNLQPGIYTSVYDTPVYPGLPLPNATPRWIKRAIFRVLELEIDRIWGKELNVFRCELGLPRIRKILWKWVHSPRLDIGLFPDWFAAPQPDWPPQTRLTGFPLYDEADHQPLPDALGRFLKGGEPPLLFTAGSAMRQAPWFFAESARACCLLKKRGLLINKFADQIPAELPPQILHVEYAPFSQVFPRCAAVTHHGGIGTTAQGLAAGVPQLVMPLAHDQLDNAARVERLGTGHAISRKSYKAEKVTVLLKEMLVNTPMRDRCRQVAQRVDGRAAIAATCDLIEKTFPEIRK